MTPFAGQIREQLDVFLTRLRTTLTADGLDVERLPGWIQAADIRAGVIGTSSVAVIDEAVRPKDSFRFRGEIGSDVVVLLDTPNFVPRTYTLKAHDTQVSIVLVGEDAMGDPSAGSTMVLAADRPAFFDCGYRGYHGPLILFDIFMQLGAGKGLGAVEKRSVPFALYLHEDDLLHMGDTWGRIAVNLLPTLKRLHDSPAGAYYLARNTRVRSLTRVARPLALSKDSGVIVLGAYKPEEARKELLQVRDRLRDRTYDAQLIVDMPEQPMMSNEEKVRLWTIVSRFLIMVDRAPSGHIAEYMIAKEQRSIMAMLRPRGSGSTFMIGDAGLVDLNFIQVFEFDESPLDVLEDAVEWAENLAAERQRQYDATYSWRRPVP